MKLNHLSRYVAARSILLLLKTPSTPSLPVPRWAAWCGLVGPGGKRASWAGQNGLSTQLAATHMVDEETPQSALSSRWRCSQRGWRGKTTEGQTGSALGRKVTL